LLAVVAREDLGMAQTSLWDRLDTLISQSLADNEAGLEEGTRDQWRCAIPADLQAETPRSSAQVIVLDHWRLGRC